MFRKEQVQQGWPYYSYNSGIVAFELRVDDWQCKLKLNQHRPESHAALHAAYVQGGAPQQALAGWMERLGLAGGASGRQGA